MSNSRESYNNIYSESVSFEIQGRRPKKISTMTKSDAERHSSQASQEHKKARSNVSLPTVKMEESELDEATYKPSKPAEPVDTRRVVTAADKKGNTEAWKRYQAGHKGYKAASHLGEKIDVGADAGATISDFVHSKSATFKGDSKKQRIKRALGAYYGSKNEEFQQFAYEFVIEALIDNKYVSSYESAVKFLRYVNEEFVENLIESSFNEEIEPPKERLKTDRNMFSIPSDEREAARQRSLAKSAAIRAKKGITKEELENLDEKARGTRPKRTVHAYDVDETLFGHGKKGKPNVKVHVNDESGKRVKSLSNQEFNTYKLDKGHKYDFSEFQSAKKFKETSSPNKKVIKDVKRKQARGQNVHIITARSKFDKPKEFHGHLKKHGVDVPMNKIHYTGGMKGNDVGKKKVDVANAVAKKSGAKKTHMYDDAAKVHKAFEAEKKNKPGPLKIRAYCLTLLVASVVMLRST